MFSPRRSDSDGFGLAHFFVITLAVFFGVLGANLALDQIRAYQVEVALKRAAHEAEQELKAMKKAADLDRQMRDQAARSRLQAETQRLASEREKRLRKEQAWREFYQPSAECRRDSMTYGCADAHIRAKTAFEAQYRD